MTERSDHALLDKLKDLIEQINERFGPSATHPIFLWSWYELPGGGYLVLPAHVPVPVDPIQPPFQPTEPPDPEELPEPTPT